MSWDDILTDPEFVKQPFPKRLEVAKNFFAQNIAGDLDYQSQAPDLQQKVKSNFFRTLGKVEAESGVSEAVSGKGIIQQTKEAIKQAPLDVIKMGEGLLKGLTMGVVDVDVSYVDVLIEQKRQKGEWTTAQGTEAIGEFIGEFLPIAGSYKLGGLLLAKYSTPIVSPAIKALAEGAYSGLIYGAAKGIVNGKSWDEVLSEAGWTSIGFGAGGAALTKATQGTGFLIAKLQKILGKEKVAKLEENLADRLVAEINAGKEQAVLDKKAALKFVRNASTVDYFNRVKRADITNKPVIEGAPQVKARGRGLEPTYGERWTYGYPGGGPPAVVKGRPDVVPFNPKIVQSTKPAAKPLQITKQNIIFGEGPVAVIPPGTRGPGIAGRPYRGKGGLPVVYKPQKDPMEKVAESLPVSMLQKPAVLGAEPIKSVAKAKPGPVPTTKPKSKIEQIWEERQQFRAAKVAKTKPTLTEISNMKESERLIEYVKEYDSLNKPDVDYGRLVNRHGQLKKGETWRDKVLQSIESYKRQEQRLPIVEVSKEEIAQAVKEQTKRGTEVSSIKDMVEEDFIELHAGLPLGAAKKYLKAITSRIGTKGRIGDLPRLTAAINGFHTPLYLSEIGVPGPSGDIVYPAKQLVNSSWEYNHKLNKVPVHYFLTTKDKILKGLSKDEKKSIAVLLSNYDKVTDILPAILKSLSPQVVKGFSGMRNVLNQGWQRMIHNKVEAIPTTPWVEYVKGKGIKMPGLSLKEKGTLSQLLGRYNSLKQIPPQELTQVSDNVKFVFDKLRTSHAVPRRVSGYLTRLFTDLSDKTPEQARQIVRNFAADNNIDYIQALRILQKRIPSKNYFGPLSEERRLREVNLDELNLDLDFVTNFYFKGLGRKMYLDRFLPEAGKLLTEVNEGTNLHKFMLDYVDQVRGLPMNSVERAFFNIPDVYTTIAGKKILLIPGTRKLMKAESMRQGITKLGGNLSFLALNSLQYPVMGTMEFIGAVLKAGVHGQGRVASRNIEAFARGSVAVFNKRGLSYAKRIGVTLDVGKGEIPIMDLPGFFSKLNALVNIGNKYVESYNRIATADAFRRLADRTIPLNTGMTAVERQRIIDRVAIRGVGKLQFFMDVTGKPKHLAGPVGSTIGRFKPYTINMLERLANADAYEWTAFLGVMDLLGGPDAIPGLRQLAFEMRDRHPDALGTQILNKMQKYSLAGQTGVDIGRVTGFGFVPGGSVVSNVWRDFGDDFWGTVGEEAGGVVAGDIKNVWNDVGNFYNDIRSGYINIKDPDIREILQLPSVTALVPMGVAIRRGARGWEEWDKKFIEYERDRKGPELTKQDVVMRAIGLTPTNVTRQQQVFKSRDVMFEEALEQKARIEDQIIKLSDKLGQVSGKDADSVADMLGDVYKQMDEFNTKQMKEIGVFITPDTLMEAFMNKDKPLAERIARSRIQTMLLQEQLQRQQQGQEGGD